MKPYERSESRIRAMYGVPTPPARGNVLELCCRTPSILAERPLHGGCAVTCVLFDHPPLDAHEIIERSNHAVCVANHEKDLPFADHSFDLVVLHDSLDRLIETDATFRRGATLVELLGRIRRVLAAGGIIAGCVANRTSLGRWTSRQVEAPETPGQLRPRAMFSIRSCRRLLARSGFVDIETFNVLPNAASPLRLINTEPRLSRLGFRRELEVMHESLSPSGYLLRRLCVEMGLSRFLEESILFWGRAR